MTGSSPIRKGRTPAPCGPSETRCGPASSRSRGAKVTPVHRSSASRPEIHAFLERNGLPEAGLAEHATDLLVARHDGRPVGTSALEVYGPEALLRSVAVEERLRGTGLGDRLTRAAVDAARARGVERVFLLTETAAAFFPKFGFADIDRADVPESIRRTVEFASVCPVSSRVMVLALKPAGS